MEYTTKTLKELQAICLERKILKSGTRSELIDRLKSNDNPPDQPEVYIPSLEVTTILFNLLKPLIELVGPLLFLGHILLKKEHGKRPGSMGTGAIEEDLWTTQMKTMNITCPVVCTQSDVGIQCQELRLPLSIKTLSKMGPLAVNWGKNKTKISFVFIAPIMIIYHKPESPKKEDKDISSGIYIIEPGWCQQNITLSSNNKSDYIIDEPTTRKMIRHSIETSLFVPIIPKKDEGTHFVFRNPHERTTNILKIPTPEMLSLLQP
jgi:hypothetical protein